MEMQAGTQEQGKKSSRVWVASASGGAREAGPRPYLGGALFQAIERKKMQTGWARYSKGAYGRDCEEGI